MTPTELANKLALHQTLDETPGYLLSEEDMMMIIRALRGGVAQGVPDAREATLRMVAGLFAESVHETYAREEVVGIVEDMIRLGSPVLAATLPPEKP